MDFNRNKIILIAGIFLLIAITASVIKFMPAKNMNSGDKGRSQEKVSKPISKPSLQSTTHSSDETNTAIVQKPSATTTIKSSSAIPEKLRDDVMLDEESQEDNVEREEPYKDDTPEQAQKRASLEKEIRTLSQAKEKEEKELSTLIASLDEAQKNSQLPPDELKKKQVEIKTIKMLLMRTYGEKLSAIDSSLQEKRQQYLDATKEKNQPPEAVEID
jgi:hypothetical protein